MATAKSNQVPRDVAGLKTALQDAAANRLKSVIPENSFIQAKAGVHRETTEDDWMVKIIVESEDLVFTFRVYYTVEDARAFASQKSSFAGKKISPFLCHDFIREYCNLTAGAVKIWLQSNYSALKECGELVVNLPNQKPAEVEPLKISQDTDDHVFDMWVYEAGDHKILCSWNVVVYDWEGVSEMLKCTRTLEDSDDGGDVEFL